MCILFHVLYLHMGLEPDAKNKLKKKTSSFCENVICMVINVHACEFVWRIEDQATPGSCIYDVFNTNILFTTVKHTNHHEGLRAYSNQSHAFYSATFCRKMLDAAYILVL